MSDLFDQELEDEDDEPRRPQKSVSAFRTISEVSQELEVPQHVLRFWEGRFPQVKPLKRGGGRRYYRPEDVQLLRRIRDLLYKEGYTIRGVQKLLRDNGRSATAPATASDATPTPTAAAAAPSPKASAKSRVPTPPEPPSATPASSGVPGPSRAELLALRGELERLRGLLDAALRRA